MENYFREIQRMIVEKDPNDDDKFLRQIFELCNQALDEIAAPK